MELLFPPLVLEIYGLCTGDSVLVNIISNLAIALLSAYVALKTAKWSVDKSISADDARNKDDIEREKQFQIQNKNRLISSILVEVYMLNKFYRENNFLHESQSYVIETSAIYATVSDQIRYLQNTELLTTLAELRLSIRETKHGLNELNSMAGEDLRNGIQAYNFKTAWSSSLVYKRPVLTKIRIMLLAEYQGDTPKLFEGWREL